MWAPAPDFLSCARRSPVRSSTSRSRIRPQETRVPPATVRELGLVNLEAFAVRIDDHDVRDYDAGTSRATFDLPATGLTLVVGRHCSRLRSGPPRRSSTELRLASVRTSRQHPGGRRWSPGFVMPRSTTNTPWKPTRSSSRPLRPRSSSMCFSGTSTFCSAGSIPACQRGDRLPLRTASQPVLADPLRLGPRLFIGFDDRELLTLGLGVGNLVDRGSRRSR